MPLTDSLITLFDVDKPKLLSMLGDALSGADDGELFIERSESETLMFDDGKLKTGSYETRQGFGLRSVAGEAAGYAHSGELSAVAMKRASDAVRAVTIGHSGTYADAPAGTNRHLYGSEESAAGAEF